MATPKSKRTPSKGGTAHPGFEKAAESAARKAGVSKERGRKIIAAAAHKASPQAKAKNPRLKKVGGAKKGGK
jgi:hypothetical protein